MQNKLLCLALLSLASSTISATPPSLPHQNESALSVSRYVDVIPGPTNAQRNPMDLVLPHISFKHNIKSVGQAINYLLSDTGYKLTRHHPDKRVLKLFRLPLPKIHRNMGPLTLAQALSVLAGEPWQLSVDPINRLISFQLPGHFKNEVAQSSTSVSPKKVTTLSKPNKTNNHSKRAIRVAQSQYKRELEAKRRARLDRKNKARLVKAQHAKKSVANTRIKKGQKQKIVAVPLTKAGRYEINWSDLPKELR